MMKQWENHLIQFIDKILIKLKDIMNRSMIKFMMEL
jgi:hypothetical protein